MTPPRGRRETRPSRRNRDNLPPEEILSVSYAGALGKVLSASVKQEPNLLDKSRLPHRSSTIHYTGRPDPKLNDSANALVVLRRLTVLDSSPSNSKARPEEPVLDWASKHRLGYQDDWAAVVDQRRRHALRALNTRQRGHRYIRRVELTAEWRLVTGLGEQTGAHEFGLSLHGTYGWPLIPGSTLKGAAAAWARHQKVSAERYTAVFGTPTTSEDEEDLHGSRCGVRFLDALPKASREPRHCLRVHSDVITPHQHTYHTDSGTEPCTPGEHHQPIPLPFLSLSGTFVADLVGDSSESTEQAAEWLARACSENGIGARTTAGYGYLTATSTDNWEEP
ncbi:type III-B CRISPR module RAMP protein Cmr6 [Thermobifida alba]|uniref:Type III-B CRISPR module RAMP protein Cmr6 n=1 Tax=Thermobifida alba TaxID=53522 RepID=A0ABY4KYX3_THEAE|nr:type III-B CRISPR module RAMP protein Cmr6 [Thermobifida alba]UPT20640.1 type III-B CRISPR module RAMP protein Cmr6 [Thermobifida alba]